VRYLTPSLAPSIEPGETEDGWCQWAQPRPGSWKRPWDRRKCKPWSGDTDIFIYPGYRFRTIDALITNFHLPRSTLLMLVSAFAGREFTLRAYEEAVRERYRFFSFGDAMVIL